MAFRKKLLVRRSGGRWELKLGADERELLASLADQLDELVRSDPNDPGLRRLFPTAYPDDVVHEAEWQVFRAEELRTEVHDHLAVLRSTGTRTELTEDEVMAWMQAINALRLVLGTRLDVSEDGNDVDPDDPDAHAFALYEFLGYLLDGTLQALMR